jgi:hypothetical protein
MGRSRQALKRENPKAWALFITVDVLGSFKLVLGVSGEVEVVLGEDEVLLEEGVMKLEFRVRPEEALDTGLVGRGILDGLC